MPFFDMLAKTWAVGDGGDSLTESTTDALLCDGGGTAAAAEEESGDAIWTRAPVATPSSSSFPAATAVASSSRSKPSGGEGESVRTSPATETEEGGSSSSSSFCDDGGGDGDGGGGSSEAEAPPGSASLVACALNQANTIVGAGMLSFPRAVGGSGYALGAALLLGFAVASVLSQRMLTRLARKYGRPSSFEKLCRCTGLPRLAPAVDASLVLVCCGAGVAYLMIAGDTLAEVCGAASFSVSAAASSSSSPAAALVASRSFWILASALAVAPLSCLESMASLGPTSAVAVACVAFIAAVVGLAPSGLVPGTCAWQDGYGGHGGGEEEAEDEGGGGLRCPVVTAPAVLGFGTVTGLAVFLFGFNCQQNCFATQHNELRDATPARADAVAYLSVGGSTVVYLVVSLAGYAAFGEGVRADVLDSFSDAAGGSDPAFAVVEVARVLVTAVVLLSYPVVMHSARASAANLLFRFPCGRRATAAAATPCGSSSSSSSGGGGGGGGYLGLPDGGEGQGEGTREGEAAAAAAAAAGASPPVAALLTGAPMHDGGGGGEWRLQPRVAGALGLVAATTAVALSFRSLDLVLGLAGATGGTLMCYVAPGLLYLRGFPAPAAAPHHQQEEGPRTVAAAGAAAAAAAAGSEEEGGATAAEGGGEPTTPGKRREEEAAAAAAAGAAGGTDDGGPLMRAAARVLVGLGAVMGPTAVCAILLEATGAASS